MMPIWSRSVPGGLRKEMLTWEPVRMVNMKQSEKDEELQPALQVYELSNLDQLFDYYNSVALFYDVTSNTTKGMAINGEGMMVQRLEGALEELLVHYPAAAGRLHISETEGRLVVEYNSAPSWHGANLLYGVPLAVAHANIALCELGDVSAPDPSLDLLYPGVPKQSQDSNGKYLPRPVMAIQVTTFTCGGFTLAHVGSHAFMDGHGAATFLQNLCSIARGGGLTVHPEMLSRREVMKPRMPPSPTVSHPSIRPMRASANVAQLAYGNATRFTFSTAALETLRQRVSSFDQEGGKKCSRYIALVALLWTARAKSRVLMSSSSTPPHPPRGQELLLRIPVNLRGKGVPGITQGYVGNAVFHCTVNATLQDLCKSPLAYVVGKIKSALVGLDMLECVQSQTDYIELQLRAGHVPCIDEYILAMPSLVSLPFYDTDCGWGRPVYCGRPNRQLAQRLIILDHPAAGAWNVLAVFNSQEEHAFFQEEIAEYISSSSTSS
eukprot:c24433_g1_i4 orf=169-1650(+)